VVAAEVLENDQTAEQRDDAGDRQQRRRQFIDPLLPLREERREEEDDHRLGELRRLQLKVSEHDPAVLAVDRRLEERQQQPAENREHEHADDPAVLQQPRVDVHEQHHQRAARNEPDALARHEVVGIPRPELLGRDDRRRAVDHHQPEDDDQHRRPEEPAVVCEFSAHGVLARVLARGPRPAARGPPVDEAWRIRVRIRSRGPRAAGCGP
jgi:hypothetical protein